MRPDHYFYTRFNLPDKIEIVFYNIIYHLTNHIIFRRFFRWFHQYENTNECIIRQINDSTFFYIAINSARDTWGVVFENIWEDIQTTCEQNIAMAIRGELTIQCVKE